MIESPLVMQVTSCCIQISNLNGKSDQTSDLSHVVCLTTLK